MQPSFSIELGQVEYVYVCDLVGNAATLGYDQLREKGLKVQVDHSRPNITYFNYYSDYDDNHAGEGGEGEGGEGGEEGDNGGGWW